MWNRAQKRRYQPLPVSHQTDTVEEKKVRRRSAFYRHPSRSEFSAGTIHSVLISS